MTCIEGTFDFAALAREKLAASEFASLAPDEKVVDLFCGAGGWGDGLASVGIKTDFAVNHDATAIEYHALNHPECVHHQGDAWRTKPRDVVGRAKVGLLLASAACTTHSRARGSAPVSKRVHMLGTCILRWMKDVSPRLVIVENVVEWMDWGPLMEKRDDRGRLVRDAGGRPVFIHDPARKGTKWRWWLRQARKLGYTLDYRTLDAADYGNASRRKRLFVILRRDGQPIIWPEVTHEAQTVRSGVRGVDGRDLARTRRDEGRPGQLVEGQAVSAVRATLGRDIGDTDGDLRGAMDASSSGSGRRRQLRDDVRGQIAGTRLPHRSAAEVIDWSDLGRSIFDRKRPLADKTLRRIVEGIRRYVIQDPRPFVLRVTHGEGGGWHVRDVNEAMQTQTTRQDLAFATPIIAPQNSGVFGQRVDETGPTITTKGHQAVIAPVLETTGYSEREGQAARAHRVSELLGTCVDGVKQGVGVPVMVPCGGPKREPTPIDANLNTVLTREDRGVAVPVFTHFRHGGAQNTDVRALLPTPMANGTHAALVAALFVKFYGNESGGQNPREPLGTCTTKDRHGLVVCTLDGEEFVIVDILFRMLKPAELARAMGFRDSYIWPKAQSKAVRLIGNAVSPVQAAALARSVLPGGRRRGKVVAA